MSSPAGAASTSVSIGVDGRPSAAVAASLIAASVDETVDGLARCELTLTNWGERDGQVGYLWFDRDVIDLGRHLAVTLGSGPRRGEVFSGIVTGLRASYATTTAPKVVVIAHDRLLALRMTRRTRTFDNLRDAEVIGAVAADHGLNVEVQADGPTHRTVAQVNTSDLAFVRERARHLDADVALRGTTLQVRARSARNALDTTWDHGSDLLAFDVAAELADQRSAVHVSGHDRQTKTHIDTRAAAADIAAELQGGQSGPGLVSEVFGDRVERLVHLAPDEPQVAQALADEALRSTARRFLTATAVIAGDARARAGTRGTFGGLGPLFSGTYGIVRVRHTFDLEHGFRTALDLERPGLGGPQ
jgi:uncharacterized protein